MKTIFGKIKEHPLFLGIEEDSFSQMLSCVQGQVQTYQKGEMVLLAGEPVERVGLLLRGNAQVVRVDAGGKQNLLDEIGPGELFGEVLACLGVQQSPVSVLAAGECEVLHLSFQKVVTVCPNTCPFHHRLLKNMLALMAERTLRLNQKLEMLSKRTTRERLVCYFDSWRQGEQHFYIPLNREELAAYLCVERSALSAELSKMQRDGLIRYHKNEFTLL